MSTERYPHPTHPEVGRAAAQPLYDPTLVGPAAPGPHRLTREQLFHDMKVRDLLLALGVSPGGRDVIYFQAHTTIETVLEAMAKERIHSAPVWVEQPERGYTQVDVQDLAAALFSLHGDDVESVKNSFFQRQVLSVASLAQRDQMRPVTLDTRVGDVLLAMVNIAHRVVVVDDIRFDSSKLLHVISQFDMLRFLDKYAAQFPIDLNTIEAYQLMNTNVVSVPPTTRAIEALSKCLQHKFSGMAIIDPANNKFVGHISVSDLRGITPTDFIDLWLPVTQYLERRGLASRPTIWCLPGSLLPEVIRRMIDNHVHRVYIADRIGHAAGIITITDLLAYLLARLFPGE